jgi:DNA-binding MarR family transcriptional regulator
MARVPNPVVELVKAWDEFEQDHPGGTIKEFCETYLLKHQLLGQAEKASPQFIEEPPMGFTNGLGVVLGRINKYMIFYARKMMQQLPVDNMEDFFYMVHLHFGGPMRKSELISKNISEFTSGTNVINRLLKSNLIEEYTDPLDARSKQVKITPAGTEWINQCLPDMVNVYHLLLGMISKDEQAMAYYILSRIDELHSDHYSNFRSMPIEDIAKELTKYTK